MVAYITAARIMVLLSCFSIPGVFNRPTLEVAGAFPPLWHTKYTERLLTTPDLIDTFLKHHSDETFQKAINATANIPWKQFQARTVLLRFVCKNGYNNVYFLKDLKTGVLGRFFPLLLYLEIDDCPLKMLNEQFFIGLGRLTTLSIACKDFTAMTYDSLTPLKSLVWVRFGNSGLRELSYKHFCHNKKLTFVSLIFNNITKFQGTGSGHTCDSDTPVNSLVLEGNNLLALKDAHFKGFHLNGVLNLANCSLNSIRESAFVGSEGILTLDIGRNNLSKIPTKLLQPVKDSLQYLNITYNYLTAFNVDQILNGMRLLITVTLHHNRISEISGHFSLLPDLELIILHNNKLKGINSATFANNSHLRELDLSYNEISHIDEHSFNNLKSLLTLKLESNKLSSLPRHLFNDLVNIKDISLESNKISSLNPLIFVNCQNLETLSLRDNLLKEFRRFVLTSTKLKHVDMSKNGLTHIPHFSNSSEKECIVLTSLKYLNIAYNDISELQTMCLNSLEYLNINHNRIAAVPDGILSNMQSLQEMYLRGNEIETLTYPLCKSSHMLQTFDCGENNIHYVKGTIFEDCVNLVTLRLDNNRLTSISPIQSLPHLHTFDVQVNQLACNCSNKNLQNWLKVDSGLRVLNYMCVNGDGTMGDFLTKELDCKTPSEHVDIKSAVISFAIILAVVFVSAAIVFYKRHEIHVIAFYKFHIRLKCLCKYRRREYTNYKYDAFISFVDHDMSFVRNDLLTLLEPQYSVCIYYRDFPVGEDIAEAILKAIKASAVTLVVLSKEYLASRWGMFEFREAHHAAMLNDNHRVVVVIPDRDVLQMKLDLILRSILYCKAYLETADILFREKLLQIMPEHSVNSIEETDQEDAIETDLINV